MFTVEASCTGGVFVPSGACRVTDNSTGTATVIMAARIAIQSEVEGKVIEAALI